MELSQKYLLASYHTSKAGESLSEAAIILGGEKVQLEYGELINSIGELVLELFQKSCNEKIKSGEEVTREQRDFLIIQKKIQKQLARTIPK